jgi:hypothetical protein
LQARAEREAHHQHEQPPRDTQGTAATRHRRNPHQQTSECGNDAASAKRAAAKAAIQSGALLSARHAVPYQIQAHEIPVGKKKPGRPDRRACRQSDAADRGRWRARHPAAWCTSTVAGIRHSSGAGAA